MPRLEDLVMSIQAARGLVAGYREFPMNSPACSVPPLCWDIHNIDSIPAPASQWSIANWHNFHHLSFVELLKLVKTRPPGWYLCKRVPYGAEHTTYDLLAVRAWGYIGPPGAQPSS